MNTKKFYITTAIPYVNAKPHVGHALEFVQADVVARYHRLRGVDVCLLSGGDENALKNVQAAQKAGQDVKLFIDENTELFRQLALNLSVQFDIFQKGSDIKNHFPSSQKLWKLCADAGDIYKKSYTGLYCLGCEAFYTADELDGNGECFEHPGRKLERVSEENYFFKLSKYQKFLIDLISSEQLKITPQARKNEILSFLKKPLLDISVSRSNERAKNWGVPVPDDPSQKIYVWFDALNIYQSGIGFGWNEKTYQKWWPADVHIIGKGISRFHAIYWPAFLKSAGLIIPKSIFVHGYFTVNGQKMSKTLGNVIDPNDYISKYGADALRYYLLREIPAYNDGDFSDNRFKDLYNSDLANGLGNLVARVARVVTQTENVIIPQTKSFNDLINSKDYSSLKKLIDEYRFHDALAWVWLLVKTTDKYINDTEPWKQTGSDKTKTINAIIPQIHTIATLLLPFLPDTGNVILTQFGSKKIDVQSPLFPRIG